MSDSIKIGAAIIEIKTTLDQLKAGLNKAKSETKQRVTEMQKTLGNIKMDMDDRLAKMKLENVRRLHKKLKQRLEEKIHLNFDQASINRTKAQLKSVEAALDKVKLKSQGISKTGSGGIGNFFGGTTGIIAKTGLISFALTQVVKLGGEAAKAQGEIEGVEAAFNLLNRPSLLAELRSATKGAISDFELMRATLTGIDLGATTGQLKTFAKFARLESIRKGTNTLQVFNNILGGVLRGSTELLDNFGISLTELNKEIEILAKEKLDKAATGLTAVERRILSVDAATKIMNERLAKSGVVAETTAQKVATIGAKLDNIGAKLGKTLQPVFSQTLDMVNDLIDGIDTLVLKAQGYGKTDLIPQLDYKAGEFTDKQRERLKNGISFIPGEGFVKLGGKNKEFIKTIAILKEELKQLQTELETTVSIDDTKTRDMLLNKIAEKNKIIDTFLKPKTKPKSIDIKFDPIALAEEDFNWLDGIIEKDDEITKKRLENEQLLSDARKSLAEDERKEAEEKLRRENEIHQLQMSAISEFGYALEGLGTHGETMVSYFNAALQAALRIAEAVNTMKTDSFSGILGIFSGTLGLAAKFIPGLAKGGSIINSGGGNISYQPYKKFATGVSNFVVPPGFNRDNYIVGVQSGERLDVTPANAVGKSNSNMSDAMLKVIADRIGAMNGNLIELHTAVEEQSILVQSNVDDQGLYLAAEKGKRKYMRYH